jgi:hypothetical protein
MAKISGVQGSSVKKANDWVGQETVVCQFGDKRLDNRFVRLVDDLWRSVGQPIPYACQDWANTKAAYRFLSNDRVTEADILSGHFESTCDRVTSTVSADKNSPILILHDTTEFTYKREPFDLVGVTNLIKSSQKKHSGRSTYTVGGIFMHSSLAVTS